MPRKKPKVIEEKITLTKKAEIFDLKNIAAIIALIVIFAFGGWGLSKYKSAETEPTVAAAQSISYDCSKGQTALDGLKQSAEVKTQDSEYGVFVDEINGTANNNGGYWLYYVNGEMGTVGVDQYNCQNGDEIEWRFEKLF